MKLIKSLHKWLSVLVALQLLIWLASGLFFNLMDHSKARGNEYRVKTEKRAAIDTARLLEPSVYLVKYALKQNSLEQQARPVYSIKLITLLSQPYYLLNHSRGLYPHFYNEHLLINAYTGEQQSIDEEMVLNIASSSYNGSGEVKSTVKILPPIADFPKEQNSVWQINFADELNTSAYIDVSSGRLVGHSNDDKRFADFFFMLHFMDYGLMGAEGGFNNGLVIFFALLLLIFCLTGAIWVIELINKGRYKIR